MGRATTISNNKKTWNDVRLTTCHPARITFPDQRGAGLDSVSDTFYEWRMSIVEATAIIVEEDEDETGNVGWTGVQEVGLTK